jgi:hypothetical protein
MDRKTPILVLVAACGGNPGLKVPAVNPSFAGAPIATPLAWVTPIPCGNHAPDHGRASSLKLDAVTHPGEMMSTFALAKAACTELTLTEMMARPPIDSTWHGSSQLTTAVAEMAAKLSAKSLAVPLANETDCVGTAEQCAGAGKQPEWAVFVFDADGSVRLYHRQDLFSPYYSDDMQHFFDAGIVVGRAE